MGTVFLDMAMSLDGFVGGLDSKDYVVLCALRGRSVCSERTNRTNGGDDSRQRRFWR